MKKKITLVEIHGKLTKYHLSVFNDGFMWKIIILYKI